ncbi:MAG TPA: GNAT family N-acetyltransferase [Thermoleophilaceae bacterium]
MRAAASHEPASTHARAARAALEWAGAEGWNPGLDDEQRFRAADPGAFFATERAGEIVATVSCALYGDAYAFIGFYIVRSDLRGRGIGSKLFDQALRRAAGRAVGLDAVLAQKQSYEQRGFEFAHGNVRWRAAGGGEPPAGLAHLPSVPFDELVAFDASVFGVERQRFLHAWVERPPGHALAYVTDGGLAGYGVLRSCQVGAKVGPLFADDEGVADALLAGLLAAAPPGSDVFIDIPAANRRAHRLHAARGMKPSFETARMYRNGRPPEDLQRVFGVTTLEFG